MHLFSTLVCKCFRLKTEMEGAGEKTRIYVGGLGGGVTEDDLRKTFSALGEVVSVDVVRTKGRSFAYLDFLPSSDKSLPKLFSTYNGCVWKGGKLRLEKAKEHYLDKLRREWKQEEESKSKPLPSSDLLLETLQKPAKPLPSSEINKQLCLFFPKLGKVKSLGQVGIGKHKYSFQRIHVPPIPTHFCDCEEHSRAFLPTNKNNKVSSEFEKTSDGGINEEEVDIMNSVMNKIFERANPSKHMVVNGNDDGIEEEDHVTDEEEDDNLIINVGNNGNDNSMDLLGEMMAANQKRKTMRVSNNNHKSELSTAIIANDDDEEMILNVANGSDSNVDLLAAEMRMMANNKDAAAKLHQGQEKKTMPPVKKRKSPPHPKEKTMIPESSRKARKVQVVESDTKKQSPATDSSLRSLKSTWKDLIGRKRNTPFTISDTIIPTIHQEKQDKYNGGDDHPEIQNREEEHLDMKTNKPEDIIHPSDHKQDQTEGSPEKHTGEDKIPAATGGGSWRQKSSWTQLVSSASHGSFSISQIVPDLSFEDNHQPVNDPSPTRVLVTESTGRKEMSSERKKRSLVIGSLESEESCPFMRTETSMDEWKSSKTSLSNKTKKSDDGGVI